MSQTPFAFWCPWMQTSLKLSVTRYTPLLLVLRKPFLNSSSSLIRVDSFWADILPHVLKARNAMWNPATLCWIGLNTAMPVKSIHVGGCPSCFRVFERFDLETLSGQMRGLWCLPKWLATRQSFNTCGDAPWSKVWATLVHHLKIGATPRSIMAFKPLQHSYVTDLMVQSSPSAPHHAEGEGAIWGFLGFRIERIPIWVLKFCLIVPHNVTIIHIDMYVPMDVWRVK